MKTVKWWMAVLVVLAISQEAGAQFVTGSQSLEKFEVIDDCLLSVYYDLEMYPAPTDRRIVYRDVQRLEIGKNVAKSSSYLLYQNDSLNTVSMARGGDGYFIQQQVLPIETHLSAKSGRTTLVYRTILGGPVLRYTEPTEKLSWQITAETDTIGGYPCQQATCQFRGRMYHAWFTMDIPLSHGPYKFHGLPGLILKLSDDGNEYIWTCTRIEKASGEPIKKYKWKYEETTPAKMAEMLQRIYSNPYKFCESLGMKFRVKRSDGSWGARGNDVAVPYNPIENPTVDEVK